MWMKLYAIALGSILIGALFFVGCAGEAERASQEEQAKSPSVTTADTENVPVEAGTGTAQEESDDSGPVVMYSSGFRMVARGTRLTTEKVDGANRHILVIPAGGLEEPFSIKGAEQKEERVLLQNDENTAAFIAEAEKETAQATFAVVIELNGTSGSYTGSVYEFRREQPNN